MIRSGLEKEYHELYEQNNRCVMCKQFINERMNTTHFDKCFDSPNSTGAKKLMEEAGTTKKDSKRKRHSALVSDQPIKMPRNDISKWDQQNRKRKPSKIVINVVVSNLTTCVINVPNNNLNYQISISNYSQNLLMYLYSAHDDPSRWWNKTEAFKFCPSSVSVWDKMAELNICETLSNKLYSTTA